MRKVLVRPTHFSFHRQGIAPRFRVHADEADAQVRLEFATRAQLLANAEAPRRNADNYFDTVAGAAGAAGRSIQLVQGRLTYELPTAVWERLKTSPHIFYRATATTQLPADWNAAAPRTVRSVDDGHAARGAGHYIAVTSDALQQPWSFPDQAPLTRVAPYYRSKLDILTRLPESNETAYLLRRLVGHPNYTSLADDQRTKALLTFAATDTPARRALLQLFGREIPAFAAGTTAQPVVRNVDFGSPRGTVLDNLVALVELDPHLEILDRSDITVAEAIEEIADPSFEINQATKGTCVPTSVSWVIATYFPAEYMRLTRGLLSDSGSVTLANGDPAAVPADVYRFDVREEATTAPAFMRRSWSERMFQAGMMSYSRPGMTYSNMRDVFTQDSRGGLTLDELCRMLRGLRNRPHRAITGSGADILSEIVTRLQSPTLPVFTALRWGTAGGHEVVSVRADASEVVFRNPWGGMTYRVGDRLNAPTRRCVNPAQAEEAMSRSDLAAALLGLVVEG